MLKVSDTSSRFNKGLAKSNSSMISETKRQLNRTDCKRNYQNINEMVGTSSEYGI